MKDGFKKYILFWFSGSVSQLGSAMTSFALILWTYTQTNSAMAVSLMSFCNFLPYILASLVAGGFVDRHRKKTIMLAADTFAAVCSLVVCILFWYGRLEIWHIYLVNAVIGLMNSFQGPAQAVAIGMMVPHERLAQMSGMTSFSSNLVSVLSPVFASAVFSLGGLGAVLVMDFLSFLFNFFVLLLFIRIPEKCKDISEGKNMLSGAADGFRFLFQTKGLWYMIVTMAAINFFSQLTYENILSPMILARSGNNSLILGVVNTVLGIGGILGGLVVSVKNFKTSSVKMIYFSAALSFLLGDLLMGLGQNVYWWSIAAVAASFPIPFIMAGQNVILYKMIPQKLQGSVFSVRNAIQHGTIPVGLLLGGFLADYVFEPFMQSENRLAGVLRYIVGSGHGAGMAVMFLCTGILGASVSLSAYHNKEIEKLQEADL